MIQSVSVNPISQDLLDFSPFSAVTLSRSIKKHLSALTIDLLSPWEEKKKKNPTTITTNNN